MRDHGASSDRVVQLNSYHCPHCYCMIRQVRPGYDVSAFLESSLFAGNIWDKNGNMQKRGQLDACLSVFQALLWNTRFPRPDMSLEFALRDVNIGILEMPFAVQLN